MSGAVTLHGIAIVTDPDATCVPTLLPTLAYELARVYGTERVAGYYTPTIYVLAPGDDLRGAPAQCRVGICTALRYVAPIADVAEAIRLLRTQTPWIPSVAA